jgi:hypothetical protein
MYSISILNQNCLPPQHYSILQIVGPQIISIRLFLRSSCIFKSEKQENKN